MDAETMGRDEETTHRGEWAEPATRSESAPRTFVVSDVLVGRRVGRYRLARKIGEGAMGVVYGAMDHDLCREVAVKIVRSGASPIERARLLREARALARVRHPNVVSVLDSGMDGDQMHMTMELCHGETVKAWLGERNRSWQEVLDVFLQAGSGLAAVHEAGLIHRDFKPDNLMRCEDGGVRLLDFGLARDVGDPDRSDRPTLLPFSFGGRGALELTRSDVVVGTPAYMAPEQFRGELGDHRSDLFSFCVSLFEALYGRRPFLGRTRLAVYTSMLRGRLWEPAAHSSVPAAIHAILLRGLSADPCYRQSSMSELLAQLRTSAMAERSLGAAQERAVLDAIRGAGSRVVEGLWALLFTEVGPTPREERMVTCEQTITTAASPLAVAANRQQDRAGWGRSSEQSTTLRVQAR